MTLLFLIPHPENTAPGQRLKFEQYYARFREAGHTVLHDAFYSSVLEARLREPLTWTTYLLLAWACVRRLSCLWRAARADVVYLFLEAVPAGPPVLEWLIAKVLRRPVVYDLDDCVFLPKPGSRRPAVFRISAARERKIAALMRWSRHVIVCTAHLEGMAKMLTDAPVTRISATIDTARYMPRVRPHRHHLTIGWSGSFSTSAYLHQLDDTIWAQGNTNVSHGCLNLSGENARWFYEFSRPGDIVEIRNTGGAPLEVWQNGDWSVPWDQWQAGSALR